MFDTTLTIPKALYTATALLKAAYAFVDVAYIHFSDADQNWEVQLREKETANYEILAEKFENELIAQAVREKVFQQTKTIREMLIARAITSTMVDTEDTLQKIESENSDISDEELDAILTSWFDRYENN